MNFKEKYLIEYHGKDSKILYISIKEFKNCSDVFEIVYTYHRSQAKLFSTIKEANEFLHKNGYKLTKHFKIQKAAFHQYYKKEFANQLYMK